MHFPGRKSQNSRNGKQVSSAGDHPQPMHPDDFAAHYAWVTAKRLHEMIMRERFAERPVFCWNIEKRPRLSPGPNPGIN